MEVILLEKIRNLGALGDTVRVKSGYGRNYLVPYGKAVYATKDNIEKFEARRAEFEKIAAEHLKAAEERQKALNALPVIAMNAKAGEEGKLFGSIGTRDIAELITKAGVPVTKSEIDLPSGVLRMLGQYDITIELYGELTATVKINVVSEAV